MDRKDDMGGDLVLDQFLSCCVKVYVFQSPVVLLHVMLYVKTSLNF